MPRPVPISLQHDQSRGGPTLEWPGKHDPGPTSPAPLLLRERFAAPTAVTDTPYPADWPAAWPQEGLLLCGDNHRLLSTLLATGFAGGVQMIYIDPPFKSGVDYARPVSPRGTATTARRKKVVQYTDVWTDGAYLQFMYERLQRMKALLSPNGSLFLHCDFRTAHHLRCLLDEVFAAERFRNQLVWAYGGSARGAKAIANQFGRNHDVILWYGNGPKAAYSPVHTERRIPLADAARHGFRQDADGQWFKTAPRGDYTDASIARLEAEGRIHRTRTGSVRIKYPLRADQRCVIETVMVGDVWTDIPDAMHSAEAETYPYPTRKPEALLERLIQCSTQPGDLVLDAFAGSGTTVAVAQKLGRRWIGCDANRTAVQLMAQRLSETIGNGTAGPSGTTGIPAAQRAFSVYHPVDSARPEAAGIVWQVTREADALVVCLSEVRLPRLSALLDHPGGDWRRLIEGLVIDPDYDGQVLCWQHVDFPGERDALVAGTYRLPLPPGPTTVAIKLVDIGGGEILATCQV